MTIKAKSFDFSGDPRIAGMKLESAIMELLDSEKKEIVTGLLGFAKDFTSMKHSDLPTDIQELITEDQHNRQMTVIMLFAIRFAELVREKPLPNLHICSTIEEFERLKKAHAEGRCTEAN